MVLYQTSTSSHRRILLDQFLHTKSIGDGGAARAHRPKPPAAHGCASAQNTAGTRTRIGVMLPCRAARLQRARDQDLTQELTAPFSTADYRTQRSDRFCVKRQQVCLVPHRGTRDFASAPARDEPRLKCVFFSRGLPVSLEREATAVHSLR